jgi:peptidoglycan/xylan/chitin deacetylase (PgdA/CDA1 family)
MRWCLVLCVVTLSGFLFGACVWSPEPPGEEGPWEGADDLGPTPTVVPPGATVVTFTFADTRKNQTKVGPLFAKYGMRSTFYISSGRIDRSSGDLSLEDLRTLASLGHEVGSHTINHVDLETVSLDVARREICDDRVALMQLGFPVTSFAYPSSSDTPAVRQIVIECNFNNARATGGIKSPEGCSSCELAETIPPRDVFRIETPTSIKNFYTLADLLGLVLQAENAGGGWIMISLHNICGGADACGDDTYEISEPLLDSFLAWLAPRSARGTLVMTTHEVIGGAVKPPVRSDGGIVDAGTFDAGVPDAGAPDAGASDAGTDAGTPVVVIPLTNPSLEADGNGDNVPDCWTRQNLGVTSGGWLRTTEAHTGSWAQRPRISSYTSGDRRLMVIQDTGMCSPAATPGRSYRVSAWYKTDSRAALVAAYRTSSGAWVNWATGPDLPTSPTTYVRGTWVTPPLPAGATRLSVGMALRGVGFAVMDDFALELLPSTPFAPEQVDPALSDDISGLRLEVDPADRED